MRKTLLSLILNIGLAVMGISAHAVAQSVPLPAKPTAPTGYNCLTREVWSPQKQAWCNKLKILQNLAYTVPNHGTVSLTNGTYQTPRLKVSLINQPELVAFGDISGDSVEDAGAILAVNSGKANQLVYLTTVLNVGGKPQPLAPILLGERDRLKSITIRDGQLVVDLANSRGTKAPQTVTQVYQVQPQLTMMSSLNEQLANTEWLLEDLGGSGVVDRVQTTIRFDGTSRITGRGGCNQYFAQFQSSGSGDIASSGKAFTVSGLGSTKKACPPAVMNQETRYFRALEQAQRISLEGPYLMIYSGGADQPLKFSRLNSQ